MEKLRAFILHGPNLNLLGVREPGLYGNESYEELMEQILDWGEGLGMELAYYQSNSEGELIQALHEAMGQFDFVVFNPGAFTHTSYALRDAVKAIGLPVIEVHITNIFNREEWRAKSVFSSVCCGFIGGLGRVGYRAALEVGAILLGQDVPLGVKGDAGSAQLGSSDEKIAEIVKLAQSKIEEAEKEAAEMRALAESCKERMEASEARLKELQAGLRGQNAGGVAAKPQEAASAPYNPEVEVSFDEEYAEAEAQDFIKPQIKKSSIHQRSRAESMFVRHGVESREESPAAESNAPERKKRRSLELVFGNSRKDGEAGTESGATGGQTSPRHAVADDIEELGDSILPD